MEAQEENVTEAPAKTMCRVCGNSSSTVVKMFTEDGQLNDLSTNVNLYLPVIVEFNDGLPVHCCWNCANTVMSWHSLYVTCQQADKNFKSAKSCPKSLEQSPEHFELKPVVEQENQLVSHIKQEVEDVFEEEEDHNDVDSSKVFALMYNRLVPIGQVQGEDAPFPQTQPPEEKAEKTKENAGVSCGLCQKVFLDLRGLGTHQRYVHGKSYKCETCGIKVYSLTKLALHMKKHMPKAPLVCKKCGKTFKYKSFLKAHKCLQKVFFCGQCGDNFSCNELLQSHICGTINEKVPNLAAKPQGKWKFSCELCHKKFMTERHYTLHRRTRHDQVLPCIHCGLLFNENTLKEHQKAHENQFSCSVCNASFKDKKTLISHKTSVHSTTSFNCDFCGEKFKSSFTFNQHFKEHHSCDSCGKSFKRIFDLKLHKQLGH